MASDHYTRDEDGYVLACIAMDQEEPRRSRGRPRLSGAARKGNHGEGGETLSLLSASPGREGVADA
jgi:hypothetical protein